MQKLEKNMKLENQFSKKKLLLKLWINIKKLINQKKIKIFQTSSIFLLKKNIKWKFIKVNKYLLFHKIGKLQMLLLKLIKLKKFIKTQIVFFLKKKKPLETEAMSQSVSKVTGWVLS